MKNRIIWCVVLVLLPLLAFGLAAMPDSVTVMISQTAILSISFFEALPDGTYPIGLAFSGLLCLLIPVIAMGYSISKKVYWLNGVMYISLGAAILAVLPLLLRTQPLTIPNAGVAILLCTESLLAYFHKRKVGSQPAEEKTAGLRLQKQ